jgi:hypothetical protein
MKKNPNNSVYSAIVVFMIFCSNPVFSQTLTQIVKGKVVDAESQVSLPGANIVITGTTPLLGAIADIDGNYKITNVPTGRYNIQISYMGYDPVIIPEIMVTSGKEVVLNVALKQSVTQMDEVTVKAYSKKDRPLNSMSTVSSRSFSVEETKRYAGGLDDPARLVSAFAGVTVGNIQDNAIVIRGNSPKGVSWRLEGVEIPNPNHLPGGNVAGGGFVTIFSSQLLSNSDFFTGAFPAEYGNALAGVFDMKLRNGNSDRRENTFQVGMLGIDVASEGPFKKGKQSTYLFNYRYSTFGLLSNLGLIPSDQIPKYQDLSFKLNFPTRSAGTFSLWGVGGIDNNVQPVEKDSSKWESDWNRIYYNWTAYTGAFGISHKYLFGNKTYINTTIASSGVQNKFNSTRLNDSLITLPDQELLDKSGKITLNTYVNYKHSARLSFKTGLNYDILMYNLNLNSTINYIPETYQNFVNEKGNNSFFQYYAQSKYTVFDHFSVNPGINLNYFALNNNYSFDPRIGIQWEFIQRHTLSFGYGKHSQLEELKIYLIKKNVNGKVNYPNKKLKLSHAQHFVLGYDWSINERLRLKVEPYYQYLYDIPGIPDSSYSMINFRQDWAFRDSLRNNSIGKNFGIDFTLERFLYKNFYYLITVSIFDSKYKGNDGVWRNTRYNKNYAFNLLFGKEFNLKNNKVLGLNTRFNFIGGERTSPVLVDKSLKEKNVFYDEHRAFEIQNPPTYYLDFTISYRINKKKFSSVWTLQVKNALGSPIIDGDGYYYNYKSAKIEKSQATVVLPFISYRIDF